MKPTLKPDILTAARIVIDARHEPCPFINAISDAELAASELDEAIGSHFRRMGKLTACDYAQMRQIALAYGLNEIAERLRV